MLRYYKPFILLTLADWYFGSWISAALQSQQPYNQAASWAYQAFYGTVVIVGLYLADRMNHKGFILGMTEYYRSNVLEAWPRFIACGLLFLGYVEDLLFYLLLHVWNPHSYDFHGRFMPEYLSGLVGWLSGMLSGGDFVLRLPLAGALVTAAIGIFFSIIYIRKIS